MRPKITSGGLTSFPSVRRSFMVRLMQLLGRRGVLGIVLFVAVAVAGSLRSRLCTTTGAAARAPCPNDPRLALGCYEQRYRSIVAGQDVAAAFADLKARYGADPELQRLCHAITHAIGQAAMARYGDVAAAFRYGDNACGSGYYHGVMQGFALTRGRTNLLSDLDAVCAGGPGKKRKSLDYFNCYQSLGRDAATISRDQVSPTVATCNLGRGHDQRAYCVLGAVLDFVYYYHSDEQAKALCAAIDRDLRQGCRSAITGLVGRF